MKWKSVHLTARFEPVSPESMQNISVIKRDFKYKSVQAPLPHRLPSPQ